VVEVVVEVDRAPCRAVVWLDECECGGEWADDVADGVDDADVPHPASNAAAPTTPTIPKRDPTSLLTT
jgi:hypothetical protein